MRFRVWDLDDNLVIEETEDKRRAYWLLAYYDQMEPRRNHGVEDVKSS